MRIPSRGEASGGQEVKPQLGNQTLRTQGPASPNGKQNVGLIPDSGAMLPLAPHAKEPQTLHLASCLLISHRTPELARAYESWEE